MFDCKCIPCISECPMQSLHLLLLLLHLMLPRTLCMLCILACLMTCSMCFVSLLEELLVECLLVLQCNLYMVLYVVLYVVRKCMVWILHMHTTRHRCTISWHMYIHMHIYTHAHACSNMPPPHHHHHTNNNNNTNTCVVPQAHACAALVPAVLDWMHVVLPVPLGCIAVLVAVHAYALATAPGVYWGGGVLGWWCIGVAMTIFH